MTCEMKLPDLSVIYRAYMYSYPHKTEYGPLGDIDVFDYLGSCDPDGLDFYFHIPFCVSKCGYCNLFSVAVRNGGNGQDGRNGRNGGNGQYSQNSDILELYLAAMEEQIEQYRAGWAARRLEGAQRAEQEASLAGVCLTGAAECEANGAGGVRQWAAEDKACGTRGETYQEMTEHATSGIGGALLQRAESETSLTSACLPAAAHATRGTRGACRTGAAHAAGWIGGAAPRSFTVGGGTPLVLSEKQLDRLFNMLPDMHKALSCIETSPNETTEAKVKLLKSYEVDRVSIGVQSFVDSELENLQRPQSARSARRALDLLKKHAFPVLNIDLIYGIPGQTLPSSKASIAEALEFEPDELFLYPLYIREGTDACKKFGKDYANSRIYEMYLQGRDLLEAAGYTQISMRRFAKQPPPRQESCGFQDVLSIGCGGRSYLGNLHFCHPYTVDGAERHKIIQRYIEEPDKTRVVNGYLLNNDEQRRRFVIKNLLHVSGLSLEDYANNFHGDVYVDFPVFRELADNAYITEADGRIQLTQLGLSLSDWIGPMLRGGSAWA